MDLPARRRPCATCPWRLDAEPGHFPPDAFRRLAESSKDMARTLFQCHDTSDAKPSTCAGFLERGADHNLTIRLAYSLGDLERTDRSGGIPLHASYAEMAVANGVDPSDPSLEGSRASAGDMRGTEAGEVMQGLQDVFRSERG